MVQVLDLPTIIVGVAVSGPILVNHDPSLPSYGALPEQVVSVSGMSWDGPAPSVGNPLSVTFTDTFEEVGSATVTWLATDASVPEGSVLRINVGGAGGVSMIADSVKTTSIAEGEEADEIITASGRLMPAMLERIVVAPERPLLSRPMSMDRVFDWTALKFEDDRWGGPGMRVTKDAWTAEWSSYHPPADVVWGRGGTLYYAPPGACYFRWEVSQPFTVNPIRWRLWSDNLATWYLDGVLIGNTTGPSRDPQMFEAVVDAGRHVLSVVCINGAGGVNPDMGGSSPTMHVVQEGETLQSIAQEVYGDPTQWSALFNVNADVIQSDAEVDGRWDPDSPGTSLTPGQTIMLPGTDRGNSRDDSRANPAGVSWALTDDGDETTMTIFQSSADDAKVLSYPARVPGMTPGKVLGLLLAEWRARGGGGFANPTFSDKTDSNGVQWPAPPDIATKVGTSLLGFLGELADTYIDWRLSQDGSTLDAYVIDTMGVNVASGGSTITRTVEKSVAQKATWLLTSSQIGWSQAGGGSGKSRYESTLGLGALRDFGEVSRVGAAQAARHGETHSETTLGVFATSLATMACVGFRPGDWLGGERVQSISMSTDDEGRAQWVISSGSALDVAAKRTQRALDKMSRGTVGGASRAAQPIVIPVTPSQTIPKTCCESTG